jgi:hypothetical protein
VKELMGSGEVEIMNSGGNLIEVMSSGGDVSSNGDPNAMGPRSENTRVGL